MMKINLDIILKWYMEIIDLDFVDVIKIVNKIPRLY